VEAIPLRLPLSTLINIKPVNEWIQESCISSHLVNQEGLFEDVTEVQEHEDGSTRPKRSPKPNPKYSPDDYDLNYMGN
jgi:hypothetical protein